MVVLKVIGGIMVSLIILGVISRFTYAMQKYFKLTDKEMEDAMREYHKYHNE